jgi:hypothetical protein
MARAWTGPASAVAVVHTGIAFAFLPLGKQQGIAHGLVRLPPQHSCLGRRAWQKPGLDLSAI